MWIIDRDILRVVQPQAGIEFINNLVNRYPRPVFLLIGAYTETVQIPGISAAGASPELRELTAPADMEILEYGYARTFGGLVPSNPAGAPGPSLITLAAFGLLPGLRYVPVDAGLKTPADLPGLLRPDGAGPAASILTGRALGSDDRRAVSLWRSGYNLGRQLGQEQATGGYLIVAETVPGGTTTALGLLLALGLDAESSVSSSMPGNAHHLKLAAAQAGLQAAGGGKGDWADRPLAGVAAVGDPMQPLAAGLAAGAAEFCPVLLAGGTQMAAVLALLAALEKSGQPERKPGSASKPLQEGRLALATTGWVAHDPTADLAGLGRAIEQRWNGPAIPYLASNLDFSGSRWPGLRLYQQGYVKEGVGAGGAALAAMLATGCSAQDLLPLVEEKAERII